MAYSRIKCPKCSTDFGQEVRFLEHLSAEHSVSSPLTLYLELFHSSQHPTCACSLDCNVALPWVGWKKGFTSKYARGHNARVFTAFSDPEVTKRAVEKRLEGHATGRNRVWNDGKTAQTDERIAQSAQKASATLRAAYTSGSIVDWHKLDPEKARAAAQKVSETKHRQHEAGKLVIWNEGETKETDSRIAAYAAKISQRYSQADAGRRVKVDELLERVKKFADKFELLSPPQEYKRRRVARLQFRCLTCDAVQFKSLAMLEDTPVCFSCHPKDSKAQLEVFDFVKSLGVEALLSDRTAISPKELDVFVPAHKLGVEYNGLYYHSSARIDKYRHQRKANACTAAGIKLFSIYEDEWRDNRPLIESMLRHRLGMPTEKLQARKMQVRELTSKETEAFFNANHLEGHARASIAFGLADKDGRIVAAMSLRTAFHKKYADYYEVARSAPLAGVAIAGWLGKLTKACVAWAKEHRRNGLVTYVDSRVGEGTGYQLAGWKLVKSSTTPRFWWTDGTYRFNRFQFKADKSRGMTQAQVAQEAGVSVICGCANSLWEAA